MNLEKIKPMQKFPDIRYVYAMYLPKLNKVGIVIQMGYFHSDGY